MWRFHVRTMESKTYIRTHWLTNGPNVAGSHVPCGVILHILLHILVYNDYYVLHVWLLTPHWIFVLTFDHNYRVLVIREPPPPPLREQRCCTPNTRGGLGGGVSSTIFVNGDCAVMRKAGCEAMWNHDAKCVSSSYSSYVYPGNLLQIALLVQPCMYFCDAIFDSIHIYGFTLDHTGQPTLMGAKLLTSG